MKRNVLNVLVAVSLVGLASPSFADEAQPELQPTRAEFGWFKRPVDATTFNPAPVGEQQYNYRFLTDYSPN